MKSETKKAHLFINYILGPVYILFMFRITFFEDYESFTEKIIAHKSDPMMYLAFILTIISWILIQSGMKFPKNNKPINKSKNHE